MTNIAREISIDSTPAQVFAVLCDLDLLPELS
ncbi:hypothetical protein BH10ACT1_BH10ACT1_17500 [soil metagenome]